MHPADLHIPGRLCAPDARTIAENRFARRCTQSTNLLKHAIDDAIVEKTELGGARFLRIAACANCCVGFDHEEVIAHVMRHGIWCRIAGPRIMPALDTYERVTCSGDCTKSLHCAFVFVEVPVMWGAFVPPEESK